MGHPFGLVTLGEGCCVQQQLGNPRVRLDTGVFVSNPSCGKW